MDLVYQKWACELKTHKDMVVGLNKCVKKNTEFMKCTQI